MGVEESSPRRSPSRRALVVRVSLTRGRLRVPVPPPPPPSSPLPPRHHRRKRVEEAEGALGKDSRVSLVSWGALAARAASPARMTARTRRGDQTQSPDSCKRTSRSTGPPTGYFCLVNHLALLNSIPFLSLSLSVPFSLTLPLLMLKELETQCFFGNFFPYSLL